MADNKNNDVINDILNQLDNAKKASEEAETAKKEDNIEKKRKIE